MLRVGILSLVRRQVKQCGGEFGMCRCRGGCRAALLKGMGEGLLHGHRPRRAGRRLSRKGEHAAPHKDEAPVAEKHWGFRLLCKSVSVEGFYD
jgi:hypothetical protein